MGTTIGYTDYKDPGASGPASTDSLDWTGIAGAKELQDVVDSGLGPRDESAYGDFGPHTPTQKRSIGDALTGLARSDQPDVSRWQRDLIEGGYLKLRKGETEDDAADGNADTRTLKAYLQLLRESSRSNVPVSDLLQRHIDQRTPSVSEGAAVREPTTAFRPGVVEPGLHRTTPLTSPAEIQFTTRNIARAVLGREPTEPEIQRAVSSIQGQERAVGQAEFNAAEKERTELFQARVAEQGAGATAEQQKQEQQIRQGEQRAGIASPGPGGMIRPVSGGSVSQKFGGSEKGTDIAVPVGTPVRAPAGGTVTTFDDPSGFVHGMYIQGDDGRRYTLGHLSEFTVTSGAHVIAGQEVAKSGGIGGHSSGPHIEVRVQDQSGRFVDPETVMGGAVPTTSITPAGGGGTVQVGPDVQLPSSLTEVTKTPSPDAEVYKELTGVGSPTRLEYGAHLAATSVFDSLIRAMRGTGFETGGVTEAGGANV